MYLNIDVTINMLNCLVEMDAACRSRLIVELFDISGLCWGFLQLFSPRPDLILHSRLLNSREFLPLCTCLFTSTGVAAA